MMFMVCLAVLAGLLVVGALIDIECRRLPNWLTGAVAAHYGIYVLLSPQPVDWLSAFIVAGLIFTLGFTAFAFQLVGGGDVKLIAGLALWAGTEHIADLLIVTSLAGGALAILMLALRHVAGSPLLMAAWLAFPKLTAGKPFDQGPAEPADAISLPYGVAIATGGFAVIHALLQL